MNPNTITSFYFITIITILENIIFSVTNPSCLFLLVFYLSSCLLRGEAPLLNGWLLHPPWVHLRACTDLLRNIHTFLNSIQRGYQLSDMLASAERFHVAFLDRVVGYHGLDFVLAVHWALGGGMAICEI